MVNTKPVEPNKDGLDSDDEASEDASDEGSDDREDDDDSNKVFYYLYITLFKCFIHHI